MILAIESSCDETAAAIVANGKILSNVVFSQIQQHQKYGGVYPELASRLHTEVITVVIDEAMKQAGISKNQLHAIAVTKGPGLVGSLHIGLQAAKTLALAWDLPLIGVNHIFGHICANLINNTISLPAISLVVSGGHTELALIDKDFNIQAIGATLDDAVGEAFDKVARLLDLSYPGGPNLDKLAQQGSATYQLPFPKNDNSFDFSFSGLKTSVLTIIYKLGAKVNQEKANIACSFVEQAVNILITKTKQALQQYNIKTLLVSGGVAANSFLRKSLLLLQPDINVFIPPLCYCGDNAAMIGIAAELLQKKGKYSQLDLAVNANLGGNYE